MKKDTYYFPHDFNARNDLKTQALLYDYKARGYGIYWVIVEMLHEASDHKLPLKPYTFIAIAQQLNDDAKLIEQVVQDCINKYDLFYESEGFISCKRVNANILRREEISLIRSKSGKSGAIAKQMLANAKQVSASAEQNQANKRKGNKRKGNEIKEDINIVFDEFWILYDKKTGKIESEKLWQQLTNEERETAMKHIPEYKKATTKQYRQAPKRYLKEKTFNDEIILPQSSTKNHSVTLQTTEHGQRARF